VTPDPAAGPALLTRFDARTGRRRMGPKPVNRERWSPLLATSDGTRLITGGPGEITVRDRSSLRTLERFTVAGHEHGEPGAYALSPDDRTLAIGNADGQMRFLDLRTGAVRRASGRHEEPVTGAAFTSDGRNLVSTAHDGKVLVWDAGQGTIAETLTGHASGIAALALSRTDDTAFTAGLDGTVMIWDLVGTRRVGQPFQAGEGDEQRPHATMSSDGRLLATGQDDGAVSLVDLRTLARRPMPVVDTGKVLGIGFVPGSRLLVVGGPEGFLALVDTRSGRVVRRLRGHTGDVFTPGVSPALLATADGSETVRLWSVPDGRPQGAPLRFPRGVEDVRLSPDGRLLAVVTVAGDIEHSTIEVLDPRTRRRVARLRVPDHVGTSGFSPDGRLFATGSRTGATQVWSTADWKPVGRPFVGDSGGILGVAISPDGRTLATGGDTGSVQVWDIPTRQAVGARLPGVPSRSAFPAFTRDGAFLIASYDTGDAYRWDVRTRSLVRHACRLAGRRLTRAEWAEFLPGRSYDPAC
jgi:WD40 repeat protein